MIVKKEVVVVMLVTNPSIGRSRIAIENNQHLENIIYNQLLENILYNQQLKNDFHFFIFCEKKLIHHWHYLDIDQKQHISTLINKKHDTSI